MFVFFIFIWIHQLLPVVCNDLFHMFHFKPKHPVTTWDRLETGVKDFEIHWISRTLSPTKRLLLLFLTELWQEFNKVLLSL